MSPRLPLVLCVAGASLARAATGGLRGVEGAGASNATAALPGVDAIVAGGAGLASQGNVSEELPPEVRNATDGLVPEAAWHWHRGHHHHHWPAAPAAPAPAPAIALAAAGSRTPGIMTLYHTTSPEVAELILKEGFKPGSGGWCGGAIYFIDHPHLPKSKYNPVTTKDGAIIEARVDMGRMATMDRKCNAGFGHGVSAAVSHGFESVTFNPGDGAEYVIHSNSRVISTRRYQ